MRDGRKAEREPSSRCGLPQTAYSVLHMYGHLAKKHTLLAGGWERRRERHEREIGLGGAPSSCPDKSPTQHLGKRHCLLQKWGWLGAANHLSRRTEKGWDLALCLLAIR